MQSVAIVNIATGRYLELWHELLPQLDEYAFQGSVVTVHLLTDEPDQVTTTGQRVQVVTHRVPPYRWPDATLRRYEMICGVAQHLADADVTMYLDVDMHIHRAFGNELESNTWRSGVALALHPGYLREAGIAGILQRLQHPRSAASDLKTLLTHGSRPGAWEDSKASLAFVPRQQRTAYVHGAVWVGKTDNLLKMCALLAHRTDTDRANGVMATWHDESHLNWFYATHGASLLDQSYSCVDGWWQTASIAPRISSVQKTEGIRQ